MDVFQKKLQKLIPLPSEDLAYYHIAQDPISGKIGEDFRPELIKRSIQVGVDEARHMQRDYQGASPLDIINQKGLKLVRKGENNATQYITMAYYEEPDKIVIYDDNTKKVQHLLAGSGFQAFSDRSFEDVVFAHELFHVVEEEKPNLYTNTVRVKLFSLGPWTRKSRLICPGEIAGMAFAKELLGLTYDPTILNYPFMFAWNEQEAEAIYQNMMQCKGRSR